MIGRGPVGWRLRQNPGLIKIINANGGAAMHNRHLSTRFSLPLILAAVLLAPSLTLAAGNNGAKELETAIEHANLAVKADSLKKHHMHLQHTVNCLVGEHGKGFDNSAGDPCKGMGQGAINDLKASASVTRMLKQAAYLARIGTRIEVAGADKKVAEAVETLLQEAKQNAAKS